MAHSGCTKTQQVLVREPASQPPSLEGRWNLVSYGPMAAETKVRADTQVFISFTNDGKISGSGGCNALTGGYTLDGERLRFTQVAGIEALHGPQDQVGVVVAEYQRRLAGNHRRG